MTDERWTKSIMNWRPPTTRPMGRPPERWTNSINSKLAASGNGPFEMEGRRGGLHPAVDK